MGLARAYDARLGGVHRALRLGAGEGLRRAAWRSLGAQLTQRRVCTVLSVSVLARAYDARLGGRWGRSSRSAVCAPCSPSRCWRGPTTRGLEVAGGAAHAAPCVHRALRLGAGEALRELRPQ